MIELLIYLFCISNYHFEIVISELSICYTRESVFVLCVFEFELMIGTILLESRFLWINESAVTNMHVAYFTSLFYYFVSLINVISHEDKSRFKKKFPFNIFTE